MRQLGPDERNAIWHCDGPAWRAFYAWFGDDAGGWHYCPADRAYWTQTVAGVRDVDATTITGDPTKDLRLFQFDELVRLGEPAYLFDQNCKAYDNPQWRDYAQRVRTELLPKLKDSAATVSLVPAGETDVKFAVELGLSIMLDKPIVAVVPPGARVPAKLVAVADCIVEGDLDDPTMAARLNAALAEVLGR